MRRRDLLRSTLGAGLGVGLGAALGAPLLAPRIARAQAARTLRFVPQADAAILDPMINLGMLKPEQAKRILMDDLVLSEPLAKEEVDRYTFDAPGQATSYFYGFSKLQSLRARVEVALGKKFDTQSYHDFILAQGLLPPELLERAVMDNYVKARLEAP